MIVYMESLEYYEREYVGLEEEKDALGNEDIWHWMSNIQSSKTNSFQKTLKKFNSNFRLAKKDPCA